jgi:phospholipid/cholesterol/gamma-HCH transport system substrate-binding protein
MKIRREIKIGILFVVALAALIWGFNYLKGVNIFYKKLNLFAIYNEVGGLGSANPVFLNGLKIGQIHSVYFEGGGSTRIVVRMIVDNDVPIPVNSIARIYSSDLMGSKAIELLLGDSEILVISNDTLQSSVQASLQEEVNRQVQPIKMKAEELISSIDTLVTAIQAVFNEQAQTNIAQSFISIRQTINTLEHTASSIDTMVLTERTRLAAILSNTEAVSSNIRRSNEEITAILRNLAAVTDSLASVNLKQTFDHLDRSSVHLSSILEKIDGGEGSLGQLVNDTTLYTELEAASRELHQLLEDMKLNPGRYVHFSVFGNRPSNQKYSPPTE